MQDPASIDERAAKAELQRSGRDALQAALELARRKAAVVAQRHPQQLVLGADQYWNAKADGSINLEIIAERASSFCSSPAVAIGWRLRRLSSAARQFAGLLSRRRSW